MDQQKLRTLVFEKTGVKIDVDDPVFALVALNEAVLAEAVERHVALLDDATRTLAARLRDGGIGPAPGGREPSSTGKGEKRTMAIAAGAALLGAILVLLGQTLFFKPAPVVRQLTEEQAGAIRNGEKLASIVQKLDAKTRDKIQAEMQKP
jgi:hypothetical protein